MSSSRHLAAIMFTDIVGYTALMGKDENQAYKLLDTNRQLQKPIIEENHGKWIKELGDGVIASFHSTTDAIQAAIGIQEACKKTEALNLRIGVHLGEVIFEHDDVFGDAVNITSRIQEAASPGSIFISEPVFQDIANKTDFRTRFVKEERLKNVRNPVRIFEVITDKNQERETFNDHEHKTGPNARSIAVLPFVNFSSDPEQEYFSDGLSEELLNRLAQVPRLKVISRTSAFSFKGKNEDVRRIGRLLDVSHILEGSVRKSGNKIRISAQLIEVQNGTHLWSQTYDRNIEDIFSVQDEISMAVVQELKIKLLEQEKSATTESAAAHQLYMKGRFEWSKRTREGFLKSIEFYEQAVLEDPGYSQAYSGMADSYTLLCGYHILGPEISIPKARMAAEKAMKLNPGLAEAFEVTGHIQFLAEKNWDEAEKNYRKAIDLNNSYATAHQRYSLILATQGKFDQAFQEITKAQNLDPVSRIINTDIGQLYFLMGDYKKAIKTCDKILEIDESFAVALFIRGLAYEQQGELNKSISDFERFSSLSHHNSIALSALAHAHALDNNQGKVSEILQELEHESFQNYVSPYCRAVIDAGMGKTEEVFKWLEKAVETSSVWMIHLHFSADPRFHDWKNDLRFKSLLQKIQLVTE